MMEGETGEVSITDMNPDVFRALLHFIYSDDLPEELQVLSLHLHISPYHSPKQLPFFLRIRLSNGLVSMFSFYCYRRCMLDVGEDRTVFVYRAVSERQRRIRVSCVSARSVC